MDAPNDGSFQTVDGRVIRDSVLILITWGVLALFVLAPLGSIVTGAWWNGWTFGNRQISWYGALLGAILAVIGILGGPAILIRIFRRESLIVGKNCLQSVVGGERVTVQIPYANIAKIELVRDQGGAHAENFIGVMLADTQDAATLCPAAEATMRALGWHHKIPKGFRPMPLEQLYELIVQQMHSP